MLHIPARVFLRVLATARIQPCPPHNPFLCCSLLVTCKDSVSAALRELSAVLHGITAAARCICCSHISDAISPPRSRGAHEMNARQQQNLVRLRRSCRPFLRLPVASALSTGIITLACYAILQSSRLHLFLQLRFSGSSWEQEGPWTPLVWSPALI